MWSTNRRIGQAELTSCRSPDAIRGYWPLTIPGLHPGYVKQEAQHWLGFFLTANGQALPATFIRAAWVKSSMRLSGLIALGISAGST